MYKHGIFFIYYNVCCTYYDWEACPSVFLVDFEGKICRKKAWGVFKKLYPYDYKKFTITYILEKGYKLKAKPALELCQSKQGGSSCLTLN